MMAGADYRNCDVCGDRCFYDANLSYEYDSEFAKSGGVKANNRATYLELGRLSRWVVVCKECSQKYRTAIVVKGKKRLTEWSPK